MNSNNTILKVENISKQYRLGLVGTGTLSDDLKRWWFSIRGKEDPFLKIGDTNDRSTKGDSDYVWALQDINFEVQKGEVLGIVGKNGAGKSTLLKILSRVTSPTTGDVKTKGRIASLLEVGTGFHPELTGRENIFLNGAILGMTKIEIQKKEQEIIDFSGCERYVDTPVKRYSSGMRVRLAFAVAAFLEPDILIIDEVLAVGDAEFQKKAIGKMQDISRGEGRTVLFVSHNMAAVKSLCTKVIVLEKGEVIFVGRPDEAITYYLRLSDTTGSGYNFNYDKAEFANNDFKIISSCIRLKDNINGNTISRNNAIIVESEIIKTNNDAINILYRFKDEQGQFIFVTSSMLNDVKVDYLGKKKPKMFIPSNFFNEGVFYVDIMITDGKNQLFLKTDILSFAVVQEETKLGEWMGKTKGPLKPVFNWEI